MLSNQRLYRIILLLAGLVFIAILVLIPIHGLATAAPLFIFLFALLGFAFSGYPALRGYVFPAFIFMGVSTALTYPHYFQTVGEFPLTQLIIPLIQLIMFGMGLSMSIRDFALVFQSPRGVLIGVSAQLMIMPIIGYCLSTVSNLPPEIAAGIVLVGCSPSGVASNVMAYLARANLALSITITSLSTLMAPLTTPLLMDVLAGELIPIDVPAMMWSIVQMILLPVGAGLLVNRMLGKQIMAFNSLMPFVSMTAIALVIVIITAAGRDSLLNIGLLLMGIVLVHNSSGYLIGYYYARLFRMNEENCRTIAIEVGMQNAGLASGIANSLGRIATMGLAPAVFGPLMNITGSILASYWHKRKPASTANE